MGIDTILDAHLLQNFTSFVVDTWVPEGPRWMVIGFLHGQPIYAPSITNREPIVHQSLPFGDGCGSVDFFVMLTRTTRHPHASVHASVRDLATASRLRRSFLPFRMTMQIFLHPQMTTMSSGSTVIVLAGD
jgi:hypothetical protein